MQQTDTLFAELEPILAGAGIVLVELSIGRRGGSAQVKATIYVPSGTGTNECAKAYRLIAPRLPAFLGIQEPSIEVASPGIDRVFKSDREWTIFAGKRVRVLLREGGDWIRGRIASVESGRARLALPGGERVVELSAVAKAALDSSQEGD